MELQWEGARLDSCRLFRRGRKRSSGGPGPVGPAGVRSGLFSPSLVGHQDSAWQASAQWMGGRVPLDLIQVLRDPPPAISSSLCGHGNRGTQQVKNYSRITGTGGRAGSRDPGSVWVWAPFCSLPKELGQVFFLSLRFLLYKMRTAVSTEFPGLDPMMMMTWGRIMTMSNACERSARFALCQVPCDSAQESLEVIRRGGPRFRTSSRAETQSPCSPGRSVPGSRPPRRAQGSPACAGAGGRGRDKMTLGCPLRRAPMFPRPGSDFRPPGRPEGAG